ncbi:hypothetical protein H0H81_009747 [Sphagnurus paluster]|uniref:NADH:flavin oxidoreductase/NADH oxidase N-terminal domain-containing protein n=1 Tax=Sphagnurus paluster TaxID=117069 RepID=A0A9P7KL06_9AGAR|nr:hypothetical protein H0H81_009747 [Sphagnurus paluster]
MAKSKLFQPIQLGDLILKHRVVLAPLTRFRATDDHVPLPHVAEYYVQRSNTPGTFLISEGTFIAHRAAGYPNVPGIWNEKQISEWRKIVDAVHAKGCFIFMQLWALGRVATPSQLTKEDPNLKYEGASTVPLPEKAGDLIPHPLTIAEINEYIELYTTAAHNAVHLAGFDGVEVHGANGYIVDQFLQDVSNVRTDAYGGSIPNRARFGLEVMEAIVRRVGEKRAAIRLSPWGSVHGNLYTGLNNQDTHADFRPAGMGMSDPKPQFGYFVEELRKRFPNLAYVHVVEPRVNGYTDISIPEGHSNDFIREIWGSGDGPNDRRLISAGGYKRANGIEVADKKGDLIAYGRPFIANPDLPYRLENDIPLTIGVRQWYYNYGSMDPKGYTDYPFAGEESTSAEYLQESKL